MYLPPRVYLQVVFLGGQRCWARSAIRATGPRREEARVTLIFTAPAETKMQRNQPAPTCRSLAEVEVVQVRMQLVSNILNSSTVLGNVQAVKSTDSP